MQVKLKRISRDTSTMFRTLEMRTVLIKDGQAADELKFGQVYELVPLRWQGPQPPSSGVIGPMSRTTVDQASLDELLDEIRRRAEIGDGKGKS